MVGPRGVGTARWPRRNRVGWVGVALVDNVAMSDKPAKPKKPDEVQPLKPPRSVTENRDAGSGPTRAAGR